MNIRVNIKQLIQNQSKIGSGGYLYLLLRLEPFLRIKLKFSSMLLYLYKNKCPIYFKIGVIFKILFIPTNI